MPEEAWHVLHEAVYTGVGHQVCGHHTLTGLSPQMFSGADLFPRLQHNMGPLGLCDRSPSKQPWSSCEMQLCMLARVYKVSYDLSYQFWFTPLTFYTSNNYPEQELRMEIELPLPSTWCEQEAQPGQQGLGMCRLDKKKLIGH